VTVRAQKERKQLMKKISYRLSAARYSIFQKMCLKDIPFSQTVLLKKTQKLTQHSILAQINTSKNTLKKMLPCLDDHLEKYLADTVNSIRGNTCRSNGNAVNPIRIEKIPFKCSITKLIT
jgi:hypothetical protein